MELVYFVQQVLYFKNKWLEPFSFEHAQAKNSTGCKPHYFEQKNCKKISNNFTVTMSEIL